MRLETINGRAIDGRTRPPVCVENDVGGNANLHGRSQLTRS